MPITNTTRITDIQRKGADPFWFPRPHPNSTDASRRAYHAGYSDAYHGYRFGSGQHGDFSDYRAGYSDGSNDRARAIAAAESAGIKAE